MVSTPLQICLFELGVRIRLKWQCTQRQFYAVRHSYWYSFANQKNWRHEYYDSCFRFHSLHVCCRNFLIKSKIHKVVYFNGIHHYFSAVFWLELLFQGSILAWHIITCHASKKLLCVFWLLVVVEMLLVNNSTPTKTLLSPDCNNANGKTMWDFAQTGSKSRPTSNGINCNFPRAVAHGP